MRAAAAAVLLAFAAAPAVSPAQEPGGQRPVPAAPAEGAPPGAVVPALTSGSGPVDVPEIPPVIVTADRIPVPAAQVGSSVTVITADEIARKQQPFVADVLRGVPGLDVARSGGPGQITSVFLRGGNSEHTLVLIDGIEANDPTSPTRAFDFSTLTVDDVDRIEVLRGPQSTLWGSNAMGGVINIITKRGEGPPHGYVFADGGSYSTAREGAGVSGGNKLVNYSFSLSREDSQSVSSDDPKFGGRTTNPYGITSAAGKFGLVLSPQFNVDFIARFLQNHTHIDDFGGPGGDDPDRVLKGEQTFLRLQPHLTLLDGFLEQTYAIDYTNYTRQDTRAMFGPGRFEGGLLKFGLQNDLHLARWNTATLGVEYEQERFTSNLQGDVAAETTSVYAQDAVSFADRLFFTAGLRYEDHTIAGPKVTYRFTGAYLFPTLGTRLHASAGTGYKVPALSELFGTGSNPNLRPETSFGYDAGVEQSFAKGRLVVDATYFHNRFSNLIQVVNFTTFQPVNVGRAETQGVEVGTTFRPTDAFSVGVNYTYTDARNLDTRAELVRRARNKVGLDVTYRYSRKGDVTLSGVYNGDRLDFDPVSGKVGPLGGYTLLNLSTSYRLTDNLTATARIENLLNRHYEEVAGFGTQRLGVFAGLRYSF